jgi:hypothetical protein
MPTRLAECRQIEWGAETIVRIPAGNWNWMENTLTGLPIR